MRGQQRTTLGAMFAIAVMMVAGGPVQNIATTVLVALAGLALLASMAVAKDRTLVRAQPLAFRIGLAGVAILPLLQIVPLPPSLWQALPGQESRVRVLELAGLANSWQPLTLTPLFTAGACVVAIAFVALVLLLLTLPAKDIRRVAALILGLVALNILIGLVQVASGGSALQLYRASDHGALIGFYANKNHAALVLAASLPIAAFFFGSRENPKGSRTWMALYAGIILVALITTNSRAGVLLGFVAVLVLGSLYIREIKPIYVAAIATAAIGAVLLISTTSAFEVVFSRFNIVDEDLRWQFFWTSQPLIERYWLWGSGIGSFSTLYAANENLAWVKPTIVNQLHNEYPQLLLEAGLPGITLLLMLAVGLAWRGAAIWISGIREHRLPLFCGALILALIAIHSGVDYPLRRPAVLPILALAMILVIRGDLTASTGLLRRKRA